MNRKSFIALSVLLAASASTSVSAVENSPVASQAGQPGTIAGRTRAEVVAELKQAIARGEITHGPLEVIYELTENRPQKNVIAREENFDKPVQDLSKLQLGAGKDSVK